MLIHRQLSARKSLQFTPALTIRIIRALPLRRNYRISLAETQTYLQGLWLFSNAYKTIDTPHCSECTHFQWLRKNLISNLAYFKYYLSECGVWYSIYHKHVQICCRKIWNGNIFLHKHLFQRKKGQKRAKRPKPISKVSQPEMRPKGQLKPFRPTNLKRGQISEIWPKKDQSGNPAWDHTVCGANMQ